MEEQREAIRGGTVCRTTLFYMRLKPQGRESPWRAGKGGRGCQRRCVPLKRRKRMTSWFFLEKMSNSGLYLHLSVVQLSCTLMLAVPNYFLEVFFSPDGVTAASPDASVRLLVYMCICTQSKVYLLCVSAVSLIQKSPKMYTATH